MVGTDIAGFLRPATRLGQSRAGVAVIAIAIVLSTWLLLAGSHSYPSLHIILDTGIFILGLTLTFFLTESGSEEGPPLAAWLSISFGTVALLALLHLGMSIDWFGWLAPIGASAERWRPSTWPPAVHVLPIGVALSISPWCRRGRAQLVFALGLLLLSALLLVFFAMSPRYTTSWPLGITRPSLLQVPLLWAAVGWLCWRLRARNRLLAPLAVMSVILTLANLGMLYSHAPHDGPAMVAHVGRVAGFLTLLTSQMRLASDDMRARLAAEHQLETLNRELEQRVRDRTAQAEERGQQLLAEGTIRLAAESRFRLVVESASSGMLMTDRTGKITLVNREAERLFGYTREELLSLSVDQLVPSRFRPSHAGYRDAFLAQPQARMMGAGRDLFGLRKNGAEFPVEIGINPIETAEGTFVLASVVDISPRKAAEADLQRSNEELRVAQEESGRRLTVLLEANRQAMFNNARLRIAVNHLPLTLYQTDLDLRYTWIISPPEVLNSSQIIGLTDHDIVPPDAAGPSMALKRRVLETGEGLREELILTMNGVRTVFDLIIEPLRDDDGRMIGLTGAAFDITARKVVEDELRRSNEELEQFAYVASHDLQEPLRMVGSYVQLLAKRYRGRLDADADDFIGFAVDGAVRMQGLIEDLLAFSRAGTRGAVLLPVDANLVVQRAMRSLSLAIEEAGATVQIAPLPMVLADAGQLEHVFQNLIANAIKFRGADPVVVKVAAVSLDSCWQFSVSDNGIGIESQYFDRIFVLFQRLHTRERYRGTGIGLAISRKIIERQGGRIWVESEVGRGATFHFTLQAVTEPLP